MFDCMMVDIWHKSSRWSVLTCVQLLDFNKFDVVGSYPRDFDFLPMKTHKKTPKSNKWSKSFPLKLFD